MFFAIINYKIIFMTIKETFETYLRLKQISGNDAIKIKEKGQANLQKADNYNNILTLYENYLNDVEKALEEMHDNPQYRRNSLVKIGKLSALDKITENNASYLLNKIGYKDKVVIDALTCFAIIFKHFKTEENIKGKDEAVEQRLKNLNEKAEGMINCVASIKTK